MVHERDTSALSVAVPDPRSPAPGPGGLVGRGGTGSRGDVVTPSAGPATHQQPVVLLVEDDAGDALLVEELVEDCQPGMTLRWAQSLAAAREALAAQRPDCVLLDLHLPDSHGLDALAAVQAAAPGVAVVVLTGLSEEATGTAAVAAGAQDYLVKGKVDSESLSRAVRYAMQRKQVERSALALRASELHARENARLERGLLPKPLLREPADLAVISRYRPGRARALLGGDFYDVVQSVDGTVHVLIGDVCGHGPDQAALGVALRIAWRTLVLSGVDNGERMRRLEQILEAERAEGHIFATVSSVALLPDRQRVRIVRAGHPGLLLREGDQVRWVEVPGGPALGVLAGSSWPEHELALSGDDWALTLFTDGLFEGRIDDAGGRLGEEALLRAAQRYAGLEAAEYVDALIEHAQGLAESHGGLDDDLAVVDVTWSRSR